MWSITSLLLDTEEDRRFFDGLYDRYHSQMLALALSQLRDEHEAEEVVNDALFSLARQVDKLRALPDEDHAVLRYMLTAVKHKAVDAIRADARWQKKIELFSALLSDASARTAEDAAVEREIIDRAKTYLRSLPPRAAEIGRRYFLENEKPSRIAQALGIPADDVSVTLKRIRREMKAALEVGI